MSKPKYQRIIDILCRRDNMTVEEATILIEETVEELEEAIDTGDYELAEDIVAGNLGLEPDYIIDLL